MDVDGPDEAVAVQDTQEKMEDMSLSEVDSDWPHEDENPVPDLALKKKNEKYQSPAKRRRKNDNPVFSPDTYVA